MFGHVPLQQLDVLAGDSRWWRVVGPAERAAALQVLAQQVVLVVEDRDRGVIEESPYAPTISRCSSAICTSGGRTCSGASLDAARRAATTAAATSGGPERTGATSPPSHGPAGDSTPVKSSQSSCR